MKFARALRLAKNSAVCIAESFSATAVATHSRQTSAPEVVKRITELETCLQHLASAVITATQDDRHPELRAAVEAAKLVLKNRLEIDDAKHRFKSELGRIIEDPPTLFPRD